MIGEKKAANRGCHCDGNGNEAKAAHVVRPEPRTNCRQHHQSHRQKRAKRLEASDQIENDQHEEQQMHRPADPAHQTQEKRVEALGHQSSPENEDDDACGHGNSDDEAQGRIIERQDRSKQDMHQINAGAAPGYDEHADGQRNEIEGRHRGILLLHREP